MCFSNLVVQYQWRVIDLQLLGKHVRNFEDIVAKFKSFIMWSQFFETVCMQYYAVLPVFQLVLGKRTSAKNSLSSC